MPNPTPDPRESPVGLRIHQAASRSTQRADDVSRPRVGPCDLPNFRLCVPRLAVAERTSQPTEISVVKDTQPLGLQTPSEVCGC
jgi:hypothetical protein